MDSSWTAFSASPPSPVVSGKSHAKGKGKGTKDRIAKRSEEFSVTVGAAPCGPSATIPDTMVWRGGKGPSASASTEGESMMAAMKGAMKGSVTTGSRRGLTLPLDHCVLASIAEDADLHAAFAGASAVTKDMVVAAAKSVKMSIGSAIRAISRAQKVSICFVVDTTGSMSSYITAVKGQIGSIIDSVRASGCKIAGLAFVGYKDWHDGSDRLQVFPFSDEPNAYSFKTFVGRITAGGGGDGPEDVIGGLMEAASLEWPENSGSRIMFHIADAPPHGRIGRRGEQYHSMPDDYPDGHDLDVTLQALFQKMQEQELDYFFGKVNDACDRMLDIFSKHSGKPVERFDLSSPASIAASVSSSVMSSVSHRSALAGHSMPRVSHLDTSVPAWTMIPVLEHQSVMTFKLPHNISEVVNFMPLEQEVHKGSFQVAPAPFAHGSVRMAFYGRRLFINADSAEVVRDIPASSKVFCAVDEVVLKEFIRPSTDDTLTRHRYIVDLETQAVAAFLANEFNSRLSRTEGRSSIRLKYLMEKLVRLTLPDGSYRFMAMEKKFRGSVSMMKYTNNYGFVRESDSPEFMDNVRLAVAFSHFSYVHSDGYCMVTDIQGVNTEDVHGRDTLLLTDPAIHCPGILRFGKTNMQQAGIDAFFKVHKCNKYCAALGLPPGEVRDAAA